MTLPAGKSFNTTRRRAHLEIRRADCETFGCKDPFTVVLRKKARTSCYAGHAKTSHPDDCRGMTAFHPLAD